MVRLFARSAKQDVQGVADDFGYGPIVRKHNVRHSREVLIEQRPQHLGFKRLDESSKTRNVGKKCGDPAPLTAKVDGVGVVGKPLRQIRRKISRQ